MGSGVASILCHVAGCGQKLGKVTHELAKGLGLELGWVVVVVVG